MGIWRYVLEEDIRIYMSYFDGIYFKNDWLLIEESYLTVRKGYAWDGCTPSYQLFKGKLLPKGLWLGIWDGPLGDDGRPVSWLASLFHDALCQFREQIEYLSKEQSVRLFERLLVEKKAPVWMCSLYPAAVMKYGPQEWLGDKK